MGMSVDDEVVRRLLDGLVDQAATLEEELRLEAAKRCGAAEAAAAEAKRKLTEALERNAELHTQVAALGRELGKATEARKAAERKAAEAAAGATAARQERDQAVDARRAAEIALGALQAGQHDKDTAREDHHAAAMEERMARLEQAVTAVAKAVASKPAAPAVAPPTYDMQVTGRDANNRPTTIRLKPVKE